VAGVVYLVVDTNLFHECRSLDAADFPWADIGAFDTVELIVTDPVLSELDRQKKDTRSRIKRRAIQAVAWFRAMLQSGAEEHVFRQATPRVVMRVSAQTASRDHPELLDLDVDDDRIVGVAFALTQAEPGRDIRVLSDDTRPMAKSKAVGLPFEFIPPSWARPAEVDDQQKEIERLKAENAALRATHPLLSLHADGAVNRRLTLSRRALLVPSPEELDALRSVLSERFSLDKISEAFPDDSEGRGPSMFGTYRNYVRVPPAERDVERYRSVTYPAWIEEALAHLVGLPATINGGIPFEKATIKLSNSGYRPAEDVRIRFVARGSFLLAPVRDEGYTPSLPALPSLPRPPRGHWLQNGNPVATVISMTQRPFDPGLRGLDLYRNNSQRDDEAWYYEPRMPEEPAESYELICRRFRHGAAPESFDLLIFSTSESPVINGALDVEVSASNLGRSVTETYPVEFQTTFASSLSVLKAFVENQKLLEANSEK
jgi:hypothetical protein